MATIVNRSSLDNISSAVADELLLDIPEGESIEIKQIAVAVTYELVKPDWLDEWCDMYDREHDEIPF